uniref:Predicted gene 15217 n=1 Tax=Mus spicilegus TaxID=10103 RepID=A0A8C6HKV1_MUSSI
MSHSSHSNIFSKTGHFSPSAEWGTLAYCVTGSSHSADVGPSSLCLAVAFLTVLLGSQGPQSPLLYAAERPHFMLNTPSNSPKDQHALIRTACLRWIWFKKRKMPARTEDTLGYHEAKGGNESPRVEISSSTGLRRCHSITGHVSSRWQRVLLPC